MKTADRLRFEAALYTLPEAARIVGVPPSTLRAWTKGYESAKGHSKHDPVIKAFAHDVRTGKTREASITFIGLVEALVLSAIRKCGVPLQRIRPALKMLSNEFDLEHVLASRKLYTDGAEVLYNYAERLKERSGGGTTKGISSLTVVRNGQRVFAEIIEEYLNLITYESDDYAKLIRLPAYKIAEVVADPTRGFGAPIFAESAVRVDSVLGRYWAGESLQEVAEDFSTSLEHVEEVVRVTSKRFS